MAADTEADASTNTEADAAADGPSADAAADSPSADAAADGPSADATALMAPDAGAAAALKSSAAILGLLEKTGDGWARGDSSDDGMSDAEIDAAIEARKQARADRDFGAADRIRDELAAQGILLEDGPEGTVWRRS